MKNILVTGSAGFIGYFVSKQLLEAGYNVIGVDNFNDYYDVDLKKNRTEQLELLAKQTGQYEMNVLDIAERDKVIQIFEKHSIETVIHLAAQAGVRYSLDNPWVYLDTNINGFLSLMEACRNHSVQHFVFASSSSVYGLNQAYPFTENSDTSHSLSLYAATKKSNECIAHSYSHLFDIPSTGLRFFNAYGAWGRPDMALFLFVKNIIEEKPIDVFNNGNMIRDFTYVEDIAKGVIKVAETPPVRNEFFNAGTPFQSDSSAAYKIYNIGNNSPVNLMDFIKAIEEKLNRKASLNFMPIQPGEVEKTYADVTKLEMDFGYKPTTSIKEGVSKFVDWYLDYYNITL